MEEGPSVCDATSQKQLNFGHYSQLENEPVEAKTCLPSSTLPFKEIKLERENKYSEKKCNTISLDNNNLKPVGVCACA